MNATVFISYASPDKDVAEQICGAFEKRQLSCFFAPRDILPGRNYGEAIAQAIEDVELLVLVLSSAATVSEHVLREVELAARHRVRIVPFRIGDVTSSKALDYFLAGAQFFDASPGTLGHGADLFAERAANLLLPDDTTQTVGGNRVEPSDLAASSDDLDHVAPRLIGTSIDRFKLQRLLGRGGSGFVFAAWDSRFNRQVCVKLFYAARRPMPNTWALCRASIKALASLEHPGIIPILDFGDHQRSWRSIWLAMELVDGQNLAAWAHGDCSLGRRLEVATAMTDALAAAHRHSYVDDFGLSRTGVYHGDLKPANVLIRADGSPVLLDFMLPDLQRTVAIEADGEALDDMPITGIMGTAGFMAPEQATYGLVSPQSDVYSLGQTFMRLFAPAVGAHDWFMTSGYPTNTGTGLSRWLGRRTRLAPLDGIPRSVGDVPDELVRLVRRMVDPDPKVRPADATIVHQALQHIRQAAR